MAQISTPKAPNAGERLHWFDTSLVVGEDIELLEAASLDTPIAALRARLEEDGYLLLRAFHPRDEVFAARSDLIAALRARGALAEGAKGDEGAPSSPNQAWPHFNQAEIALWSNYQALVCSARIHGLFSRLLGGETTTLDHKWMRVMYPGFGGANPHCDIVYMGGGTDRLYTVWTPLGDVPYEMGPLMILPQAHRHPLIREQYGRGDAHSGSYSSFSTDVSAASRIIGTKWRTTAFAAGDILLFGMYTMHASLSNCCDRLRLSTDTRYQLANEPIDDRHMGKDLEYKLHPNPKDFLSQHATT
jgi:ectoine hydroxylase-related dioxygenase (phytanoyl-CoA dioxygenase family)